MATFWHKILSPIYPCIHFKVWFYFMWPCCFTLKVFLDEIYILCGIKFWQEKIVTGENIDKFDEFPSIQFLATYLPLMNLWQSSSTRNKIISVRCLFRKSQHLKLAYWCIPSTFINVIAELIVNECSSIPAQVITN